MKKHTLLYLLLLGFLTSCASHEKTTRHTNTNISPASSDNTSVEMTETNTAISITINEQTFTGTLISSPTTSAFKKLLPLDMTMTELNGNEKYYHLPQKLPTNPESIQTIQAGDLMLFGSDTLVLFYEDFSTSYSYTPLGNIANPSDLKEALGRGDSPITITLTK